MDQPVRTHLVPVFWTLVPGLGNTESPMGGILGILLVANPWRGVEWAARFFPL